MDMDVVVLDGGFATELERRGYNAEADPLFGGSFLKTDPEAILSVHKSFLQEEADVIMTATYQANVDTLCKYLNVTATEACELIQKSVHLAKIAVMNFQNKSQDRPEDAERRIPMVAGSVGPFAASLRDGSEYHGSYASYVTEETLVDWHRPRIQNLAKAGVDLLAIETIPCAKESRALMRLLKEFPSTKALLSFSCEANGRTCHGDDFLETIQSCVNRDENRQLLGVGINCCPPSIISDLLRYIDVLQGQIPFVVYPNSGESWSKEKSWVGRDEIPAINTFVSEWIDLGARYVGGCCRVTPEDIRGIAAVVHGRR